MTWVDAEFKNPIGQLPEHVIFFRIGRPLPPGKAILRAQGPFFHSAYGVQTDMPLQKLKEYAFVPTAIALNLLFFHGGIFFEKTFFFRDIHRWFYPMKYFLAGSYRAGEIPYWCPNYFCGSPFMSDIQSGVFYPLSAIFLIIPFPWSFNLFVAAHLLLGFCFFYLFIASLGLSRKSALLMSISFCYGGYILASVNTLNNLTTAVWLPAILWAFNRMRITGSWSWFFLTVIFTSTAVLGGEPQLFILMVSIFLLQAVTSEADERSKNSLKFRYLAIAALVAVWAGLMTMVQLGPTFTDYLHSARLGGLPYREVSRFSLEPSMLKHLLIPLHFPEGFSSAPETLGDFFPGEGEIPWLLTVYPGVIILPLGLLGAASLLSEKKILWPLVFLVSVVLALGENTPAHQLFYRILPFFRFPAKFMFPAGFSLLVMGAYGFDKLLDMTGKSRLKPTLLFCLLAFLLTLDLYFNHRNLNPVCEADFYRYHHPALQPLVDDPELFRVFADRMPTPRPIRNSISNHHIKWQMMLLPNLGIINHLYHVGGTPALELRYQHQITEILTRPWKEKIHFLKLANVKYIVSQQRLDKDPDLKDEVDRINGLVYRIKDFLPRAWIVGKMENIEEGTVDALTKRPFDPSTSALGRVESGQSYHTPFFEKVNRIVYGKNGEIRIEARTRRPGVLVVSESAYPGWRVTVDGRPGKVLRLDLLFQGVALETGKHQVVFRFRPCHFKEYVFISLASSGLFFGAWLFVLVRAGFRPSSSQRSRRRSSRPR